jgi:hypothetical protein
MTHLARRGNILSAEIGIEMFDLTGEPTLACICGCLMFEITVMWDEDRTVGWYDLRQKCKDCGSISTAPTPIDGEM